MKNLFLPVFDWGWGVFGAAFMFVVFLGLVVALLLLMRGGKKQ
ncbi:MAG: hypothetical protein ABFR05_02205 [Bacteroidota bacterium]